MKILIIALYETGEVINLNEAGIIPNSQAIAFIKCKYEGMPKENESWSYLVFDNELNIIADNSFKWLGFTCLIDKDDSWSYPLDDWNGNHHQWRRIRTSISNGSKSISINLRHTYHMGEAFRTLSAILSVAKEQGLIAAKEEFRTFSKREPGA